MQLQKIPLLLYVIDRCYYVLLVFAVNMSVRLLLANGPLKKFGDLKGCKRDFFFLVFCLWQQVHTVYFLGQPTFFEFPVLFFDINYEAH